MVLSDVGRQRALVAFFFVQRPGKLGEFASTHDDDLSWAGGQCEALSATYVGSGRARAKEPRVFSQEVVCAYAKLRSHSQRVNKQ